MVAAARAGVRLLLLASAFSVLLVVPALAQQPVTSFDELGRIVTPGQTIFVTDGSGTTLKGTLAQVAGAALEVRVRHEEAPRRFLECDVNNVVAERRDPLWNGMLIGFATGAVPGVLIELAQPSKFDAHGPVGLAAVGFLTGWLIDAVNKEKVTVFVHAPAPQSRSIGVAPLLGKSRTGVQLSVKF